jgi:uncharacterized membrane protein
MAALFILTTKWKHPKDRWIADGWINKMWHIHTMECYPVIKMECSIDSHYNMDES